MYVKCQIILITQGLRVCEMPDNTYNARSSFQIIVITQVFVYVKCQIILITQGLRVKCQIILITQGLRVCEMPDNTYNARSSCM